MPGGTPRFVSVFDPYRCIFVFVDKMAEKKLIQSKFPTCIYLFLFYFCFIFDFEVGKCNCCCLLRYHIPYREEIHSLYVHVYLSGAFLQLIAHRRTFSLR